MGFYTNPPFEGIKRPFFGVKKAGENENRN